MKVAKAFMSLVIVFLLVLSAISAHSDEYARACFRMLAALYIHIVFLKEG